jgi:hypothetical protein
MYGRIVFGEVSDFLDGLGDRLTDIEPVEILTLVPLATLVVVFGIQPGLLLDLVQGTVDATVEAAESGSVIAIGSEVTLVLIGLVVVGILARVLWALMRGDASTGAAPAASTEGGGH